MKKYILPFLSTLTLIFLLVQGFRGITSIEKRPLLYSAELINGKLVQTIRKEFDLKIPLRDRAISFWSYLKLSLFNEGSAGVLIGREYWLYTSEEYEEQIDAEISRDEFFRKVEEVNDYFKERGISLIVALVPSKARVYQEYITRFPFSEELDSRYNLSLQRLIKSGIRSIDLNKAFKEQSHLQQLFYKNDTHWTFSGATVAAEEIQKQMVFLTSHYGFTKRSFSLTEGNDQLFTGDLLNYVPSLKSFSESYKEIEIIDNNPPELGLFDEIEIPVILVGTSYSSDSRWNFEAALKKSLQLDVLNLAAEGEGPFPPMTGLMESEYFYEINSKIIIWEIPERYIPLN